MLRGYEQVLDNVAEICDIGLNSPVSIIQLALGGLKRI